MHWRIVPILGLVLALSVLLVAGAAMAQQVPAPPPGSKPVPPSGVRQGPVPSVRVGEFNYARDTRGKPITLGGKRVALPPDAYVKSLVAHVSCGGAYPCPETPYYVIVRGQSRILVAIRSGKIINEDIAPGEAGAFDFLKAALR